MILIDRFEYQIWSWDDFVGNPPNWPRRDNVQLENHGTKRRIFHHAALDYWVLLVGIPDMNGIEDSTLNSLSNFYVSF